MNFSQRQRDPRKHLVGLSAVIVFHAFVIYALMTGLAKKVVEVVRAPIETKVIEEVKPPPPPPETVVPPPPRLEAPPPPFIPPPEIQIATPPPPAPTITAVTPTPPPAPVEMKPAPPPPPVAVAPAPPPPAAPPAVASAGVVCPAIKTTLSDIGFPRDAARAGLEKGSVELELLIAANGAIKSITVKNASHPVFARFATRSLQDVKCPAQAGGADVVAKQEIVFNTR